jgi:hypothetical protein
VRKGISVTIVISLVAALGGLVLLVLAYAVGRLQGEVKRLRRDLEVAHSEPARPAAEQPADALPIEIVSASDESDEVPVITAIDQRGDELDLSVGRVASVTLARPLIKVAAFSHGLRRALGDENRFRMRHAMRQEFKRQRKSRRRRRAGRAPATFDSVRRKAERGR